jgi:hypothetical protein
VVRPVVVTKAAATSAIAKKSVPLKLEEGEMPLNTYNNKAPFKARIKSVERIVGPKATGETMHIIIETDGKIPFWEGQSYGVIPPVRVVFFSRCCALAVEFASLSLAAHTHTTKRRSRLSEA